MIWPCLSDSSSLMNYRCISCIIGYWFLRSFEGVHSWSIRNLRPSNKLNRSAYRCHTRIWIKPHYCMKQSTAWRQWSVLNFLPSEWLTRYAFLHLLGCDGRPLNRCSYDFLVRRFTAFNAIRLDATRSVGVWSRRSLARFAVSLWHDWKPRLREPTSLPSTDIHRADLTLSQVET